MNEQHSSLGNGQQEPSAVQVQFSGGDLVHLDLTSTSATSGEEPTPPAVNTIPPEIFWNEQSKHFFNSSYRENLFGLVRLNCRLFLKVRTLC